MAPAAEPATVRALRQVRHRVLGSPLTEELGRLALLVAAYVSLTDAGSWVFKLDSYVYYAAVEQWQDGGDLYRWYANPDQQLWPFTYTPLAAWLLVALTGLTYEWATALLVAATPACAAVTAWAVLHALRDRPPSGGPPSSPPSRPPSRAPGASPPGDARLPHPLSAREARSLAPWLGLLALMVLEPFPKTMEYGQVNAVLMALVAVDVLVLPEGSRWRGALSGLAAAVKLTPAVAVLVFLAGRQWRAAMTMVASAAGTTLLAGLASPGETWDFFTWAMWDTGRAGFRDFSGNQNIQGAVARSLPESLWSPAWALGAALAVLGAWMLCRRLDALAPAAPTATAPSTPTAIPTATPTTMRSSALPTWAPTRSLVVTLQLSVVMVLGLIVSPISWSHHWVWALPALMVLAAAARRWRSPGLATAAVAGAAVFFLAAHWWFPEQNHVEQDWPAWAKLVGSSYTWWALGSGAALWVASGRVLSLRRSGTDRKIFPRESGESVCP
ncbi:glycosyltransferase 87 family protein [Actinomyces wuliandei]|uniref:glycosyltransferase 87 family protein n=1 Tax=Actinomyces wuliandei TaxID=2057743 RepID=UPI00214BDA50|nr:glycosyltransferase 87 family protein [Actinomyces wuliandei]